MPHRRRVDRHVKVLIVMAAALWAAVIGLAIAEAVGDTGLDLGRSVTQTLAAVMSMFAGMAWFAARRHGIRATTWARAEAPDTSQITIEIPRVKIARMEEHVPRPRSELADMPPVVMAQLFRLGVADAREGRHRP